MSEEIKKVEVLPEFVTAGNVPAIIEEVQLELSEKKVIKTSQFRPMIYSKVKPTDVQSNKKHKFEYPYIAQYINNGIRVFAEHIDGRTYIFRQNGSRLELNSVEDQLEYVFARFPFLTHLDCEVYVDGCSIAQVNNVINYVNNPEETSITDDLRSKELRLAIYDVPMDNIIARNRRNILIEIDKFCKEKNFSFIDIDPGTIVKDGIEAFRAYGMSLAKGKEGICLIKLDSVYKVGAKVMDKIKLI